ncbi:MAG: hypothetical protein SWZ49_22095 [Cyanobacteriota bacterium]|nr:hypothetical protein [Cyanobacteriota bacterium]
MKKQEVINEREILLIYVVANNISVKQLYFSFGFKIYGIEKMAYKSNSQYFDLDYMSLAISKVFSQNSVETLYTTSPHNFWKNPTIQN